LKDVFHSFEVTFNKVDQNSEADHPLGNSVGAIGWLVRIHFLIEGKLLMGRLVTLVLALSGITISTRLGGLG